VPEAPGPSGGAGPRGSRLGGGLRLAATMLTVLPVRATRADRPAAAVAMAAAPLVGAALGCVLALLLRAGDLVLPAWVAAALTVAAGVLATRGLHLDGLADTADALGAYAGPARALEIMKKPDIGPFGVAAVALVLLVQAAAVAAVGPGAVVAGWAAGRLAVPVACRRGVPAARPAGLGALVAGTVRRPVAGAAAAAVALGAVWAVPGRPWQGPAAVAAALLVALALTRHAVRRFGGVTGDVLGAGVEAATTAALVVLSLR
jgi:adenosylcobinamide-GDP ribazoletransferase